MSKITQYPVVSTYDENDIALIDGAQGTRAIKIPNLAPAVDSTLSIEGKAADAKVTGDRLDVLSNELNGKKSDNLFYYKENPDAEIGRYYTTDGTKVEASSWSTVDIQIGDYNKIEYSGLSAEGGSAVVSCWFNENKEFMSYFKQYTGVNILDIPDGAAWVGFSINRNNTVINNFAVYGIINGSITDIKNDIASINGDIEEIENTIEQIDKGDVIPDYFTTQLETKTAEIINNMNAVGENGETFVFITDIHWKTNYKNSPALVKYILEHSKVNHVFCGGDLINEGEKNEMYAVIIECIRKFQFGISKYFLPIARGNHDDNSNWSSSEDVAAHEFNYNTVFALLYKDIADKVTFLRPEIEFSFYFDAVSSKTRYIFIDTQRNGRTIPTTALINLLNTTPNGYNIVFFAHYIYTSSGFTSGALLLFNMIKAFNDKTTGSYAGANFDFTNSNGKAVCVIAGHTHADYQWAKDDAENVSGVPIIITDTDSNLTSAAVEGTTDSQCFDVITINYNDNSIKCVRIGRGTNRTFNFD